MRYFYKKYLIFLLFPNNFCVIHFSGVISCNIKFAYPTGQVTSARRLWERVRRRSRYPTLRISRRWWLRRRGLTHARSAARRSWWSITCRRTCGYTPASGHTSVPSVVRALRSNTASARTSCYTQQTGRTSVLSVTSPSRSNTTWYVDYGTVDSQLSKLIRTKTTLDMVKFRYFRGLNDK